MKEYNIGPGDYFNENGPNHVFNHIMVPFLLKLGIRPTDMDKVANMFTKIYNIGYSNGADNERIKD